MELPSIAGFRDTMHGYTSTLRQYSDVQLVLAALLSGVVSSALSAVVLSLVVLRMIEAATGRMGEYDGAIVSAFVLFVMAGTGFVAGFSGTLGIARRSFAVPVVATFIALFVMSASWFATAHLAQTLWLVTPVTTVAITAAVLLRSSR